MNKSEMFETISTHNKRNKQTYEAINIKRKENKEEISFNKHM